MKTIKEMHILVGLPGSGKTTFASKYMNNDNYNRYYYSTKNDKEADVLDFDYYRATMGLNFTFDDILRCKGSIYTNIIICDGLFLNQSEVEYLISFFMCNSNFNKRYKIGKIIIDYWTPDINACLYNDRGRRDKNSVDTIKGIKLGKINPKEIEFKFRIPTELVTHKIVRKPEYKVMADEYGVNVKNGKYLYSDTWCLGGTNRSYDGSLYPIDAEEPVNFDAFDELLEKICPTITFLQYKKLYSYCVTMQSKENNDYYSSTTDGYYCCNLEKLYEKLKEMGII